MEQGSMALDITSIATEEQHTDPKDIVNGDGIPSIVYLSGLRSASRPEVEGIASALQGFGLRSDISAKADRTAWEKCNRPVTKDKYPWFSLAHIRDYLRFRTYLDQAADFERVLSHFADLQREGRISIVKLDTRKLLLPAAFGWRMISSDLRVSSTGLIVEHYMTFGEMIEINEAWLHKVYEAWRSKDTDELTMQELGSFNRDERFSRHAYREFLYDGILRGQPPGPPLPTDRKAAGDAILSSLKSALNLP
jgi:hypothetical protein